jgi:uncharacterized protein (TIGR02266 family)
MADDPKRPKSNTDRRQPADKRRHRRVDFFNPVKVVVPDDETAIDVFAGNVSKGGIFLRSNRPLNEGQRVRLNFDTGKGPVEVEQGEVRWTKKFEPISIDGSAPGMGVEFQKMSPDAQHNIESFIDEVIGAEPATTAPPPVDLAPPTSDPGPVPEGSIAGGHKLELGKKPDNAAAAEPAQPKQPPPQPEPQPASASLDLGHGTAPPPPGEPFIAAFKEQADAQDQSAPQAQAGQPAEAASQAQAGQPAEADSQAQAGQPAEADSQAQAGQPAEADSQAQAGLIEEDMAVLSKPPPPKTRMLLFVGFVVLVAVVTFLTLMWLNPFQHQSPTKPVPPPEKEPATEPAEPAVADSQAKAGEPSEADSQAKEGADSQPKAGQPAEADSQPKADQPAEADSQAKEGADSQPKAGQPAEADSQPKADQPAEADSQPKADQPAEADSQAKEGADSQPKADQPAEADSQPKAGQPAEADSQAKAGALIRRPLFERASDGWRMTVPLSRRADERHFTLESPPRLAIDVKDGRWQGPGQIDAPAPFVERIRFGKQPDAVRLVLDFAGRRVPELRVHSSADGIEVVFPSTR